MLWCSMVNTWKLWIALNQRQRQTQLMFHCREYFVVILLESWNICYWCYSFCSTIAYANILLSMFVFFFFFAKFFVFYFCLDWFGCVRSSTNHKTIVQSITYNVRNETFTYMCMMHDALWFCELWWWHDICSNRWLLFKSNSKVALDRYGNTCSWDIQPFHSVSLLIHNFSSFLLFFFLQFSSDDLACLQKLDCSIVSAICSFLFIVRLQKIFRFENYYEFFDEQPEVT